MRAASARNLGKTLLLVGILASPAAGLGWLLAGQRGATLFVGSALVGAASVFAIGDRALLGMAGARPFALAEDPLLRSTVDRLAAQLGVRPPKLYLLDDGFPRAFAVGRGPRSSTVAVSRGLLYALPPAELEAVLAHELVHVRTHDVVTQTLTVLLASTLMEASRIGGWLSRTLLYVLAPVAAAFVHLVLSPKRELLADAEAARIAGWEHVADALLRLDRASDLVQFEASPATEPLYTVSPFDTDDRLTRMFVTHPPVAERVQRLRAAGG